MDKNEIMVRYWTHQEFIKRIGSYSLTRELQLSDLGTTKEMKAETQKCYTEIKKKGYELSIIDYLCFLSFLYLRESVPETEKTPEQKIKYILKNYNSHKEEANNMLRILVKKPELFFIGFATDDVEIYKYFFGYWVIIYMESYNQESKIKSKS